MLVPLIILAILSVIGGWIGWPEGLGGGNWFAHFLNPVYRPPELRADSVALARRGQHAEPSPAGSSDRASAGCSVHCGRRGRLVRRPLDVLPAPGTADRLAHQMRGLYALIVNKYWVDELYGAIIVAPVLFMARWVLGVLIDRGVIDGGGLAAGYSAQGFGALVARIQSGNIRSYAGWLALFAALLLAATYFGWIAHFVAR